MVLEEVLKLVGQYGLPIVLLIVVGYAYGRKEREHLEDRRKWHAERHEERNRWQTERDEERDRWHEERERVFQANKADAERMQTTLLRSQELAASAIHDASKVAVALEQAMKEVREARERDLFQTGPRQPLRPPR